MNLDLCQKIVQALLPETNPVDIGGIFDMMRVDALKTFNAGIQNAHQQNRSSFDFMGGMMNGIALALATAEQKNVPILLEAIRSMKEEMENGELRSISGADSGDGGDPEAGSGNAGYLH